VTWSKTEQQRDPGRRGVAAPLIDRKGRCKGAVGATMPMTADRSSLHMLDAMRPLLQETARTRL
jgi:IclR family pca regulon transcriptional regulator